MYAPNAIDSLGLPLIYRRTRAYAAPVIRATGAPTLFNPTSDYDWHADQPFAPWVDLGWIDSLTRTSETVVAEVNSGAPATARFQVRKSLGATVSCNFLMRNKLSMALASGSQHLNLLDTMNQSMRAGGEVPTVPPISLTSGSSATTLYLNGKVGSISVGSYVAVDDDYSAQSGFVGAGLSGAYINPDAVAAKDGDYIRRISFNVGRVSGILSDGALQLTAPLMAGVPSATMKIQKVVGFVSREGGSFFQEWSALFVRSGAQGDKSFIYYPRLQSSRSAKEAVDALAPNLSLSKLYGEYRALPIIDVYDGEQVLAYDSYLPKPPALV